jgi:hypothetical protein
LSTETTGYPITGASAFKEQDFVMQRDGSAAYTFRSLCRMVNAERFRELLDSSNSSIMSLKHLVYFVVS